jgi:uncharacterized membrane protein
MHSLSNLAAGWVWPQHTGTETLAIFLRWVHFLAAITWIGLLYFINFVYGSFMKQLEPAEKAKVFKHLTLPVLWWLRWSAAVTVFVGFWYWAQVYVAVDAHNAGKSAWTTIGLFLLVWVVAWHIFFAVVRRTPNPWLLAAIVVVVVSAASWLFVNFTPVGGDDNHVLAIGVGGGIGFFLLFNVWGIIWRNQKKIIQGTLAGTPPADAMVLARQIFLTSRTSAYLTIPLLFFMGAASHYPILGK